MLISRPALAVQIPSTEHAKHWYFTEAKSTELQAAFNLFLAHNMKDFMKSLSLMGTFLNPEGKAHPNCKARNKWGGEKKCSVGVCEQLTPLSVTWQFSTQMVISTPQKFNIFTLNRDGGKRRGRKILNQSWKKKTFLWDLAHTITITVSAQTLTLSEVWEIQVGNIERILNAQSYTNYAWTNNV